MKVRFNTFSCNGIKFKINALLKTQFDIMKKAVRNDFDAIFIVDGEIEGTGKSVLAQQCAFYCDPTFNVERIVFSPEEFEDAVINSDKYTSIIWDEAYEGCNKFAILSYINQKIRSLLRQIRQKNLFIFIVIPAITDLDYDIAVRRSWALIRAQLKPNYETLELERGNFTFYSRRQKKWLYYVEANRLEVKKNYKCSNSFVGFFENVYTVNKQLYLEKKSEIRLSNFIDERTFVSECIRRGIPYGQSSKLKDYIKFSEQHYYRLKSKISLTHRPL